MDCFALHLEKIKHTGPVLRQKGEVWAKLATEVTSAGLFIASLLVSRRM